MLRREVAPARVPLLTLPYVAFVAGLTAFAFWLGYGGAL